MTDKPIPHGTRNGYVNYKCRCADCRRVNAEYGRQRYQSDPDVRAKQLAASAARYRALCRLADLYPAQYAILLNQETAR